MRGRSDSGDHPFLGFFSSLVLEVDLSMSVDEVSVFLLEHLFSVLFLSALEFYFLELHLLFPGLHFGLVVQLLGRLRDLALDVPYVGSLLSEVSLQVLVLAFCVLDLLQQVGFLLVEPRELGLDFSGLYS